jgi:hypothetical protein
MKITFEINIDSLNDITVQTISDYFTGNLNTANAYNKADMLQPYIEGCLSDPFSRLDLKFTIAETNYDDRFAGPVCEAELDEYDWSDLKNRIR